MTEHQDQTLTNHINGTNNNINTHIQSNCLLCGSRGLNSQIQEDYREKWSSNWCSLFSIQNEEVKSVIMDAIYCVECRDELGNIENLLTEMGKINSSVEIMKLNNLYKLKDSIQSLQVHQQSSEEEVKKRLMLFECMQNCSSVILSPPSISSLSNNVTTEKVVESDSITSNCNDENNGNVIKTTATGLNANKEKEIENSVVMNNACAILNRRFNLTECFVRIPRISVSDSTKRSMNPALATQFGTVQTLNTSTTQLNPFLVAYHAEINSLSVPKDDDGLILQRLQNLKELTIEVKKLSIPFSVNNIKVPDATGIQQTQNNSAGNDSCSSKSQILITLNAQEMDSFADCDTVELPSETYWREKNLAGSPRLLLQSTSPTLIDLVETDDESVIELIDDASNDDKTEPESIQHKDRVALSDSTLKSVLVEEYKILQKIHEMKKSVVASSSSSSAVHCEQELVNVVSGDSRDVIRNFAKEKESLSFAHPSSSTTALSFKHENTNRDTNCFIGARIQKLSFECPRPKCGRLFESQLKRDAHVKRLHEGIKFPYRCSFYECNQAFANYGDLDEHEACNHKGTTPLYCLENGCSMKFYTKMKWTQHRHISHSHQRRQHVCKLCGQLFYTAKKYRDHVRQHSVKFRFQNPDKIAKTKRVNSSASCSER